MTYKPGWHGPAGCAIVYQDGGNSYARAANGDLISSATTSAANNVTVIQAAIDAVDGTYTPGTLTTLGHGGGASVTLSDGLWETSGTIIQKYGVSILGSTGVFDRNGLVASAHSFQGTVIAPTSGLSSMDIEEGAGTTTRTPVILCGYTNNGAGQSETNPHGATIAGLSIDMRRKTTAQGIVIGDSQFVYVHNVSIANARGTGGVGIEVISTNAPDNGAHGIHISNSFIANCTRGLSANGSGATDSFLTGCRIVQCVDYSVVVGESGGGGGWQISNNHFTTGSTDQNAGDPQGHVYYSGGPGMVSTNYFDTTGGRCIYGDTALLLVTGNYFKCSGTRVAPIYLSGNARRGSITGNSMQAGASTKALVQVSATTGDTYRPIVTGNVIGDGGNSALVAAVIDNSGNAVAESDTAATVARDTTTNPYIWGNRFVVSNV
jgi:hypothetical protein